MNLLLSFSDRPIKAGKLARYPLGSWIALPLAITIHLVVLWSWSPFRNVVSPADVTSSELLVRLIPFPVLKPMAQEISKPVRTEAQPVRKQKKAEIKPEIKTEIKTENKRLEAIASQPRNPMEVGEFEKESKPKAPARAAISVDEIMANARRDIGKIDRDLRKAYPTLPQAPPKSIQSKLESGIAAAAAPSGWLSAAGATEIPSPAGSGKRTYKIRTPVGSYCITYDANSLDGSDKFQNGVRPKTHTCPN